MNAEPAKPQDRQLALPELAPGVPPSEDRICEGGNLMDATTRGKLIERYKEGPRVLTEALEGITDGELDARPGPNEWTAREVAHHMADSEMTSAIRLRRLLAENQPEIAGYDEEEFARRLFYDERPIEASLEAVRAARRTTAEILDRLTEEQ
jgi:hypothetical protein